ncbi:hypothetical protein A9Q83_01420 [Alphaproteobacteria bacterium 46_93_T64]|nr:hypothetical protein A9Q83_01420 [Alphaproteobacteria bacterium 46_93_T64]
MRNTTKSYLDFRYLDKNLAIFVRHVTKKPIWYMRARVGKQYITESLGTVDDAEAITEARQRFYKLQDRHKQNIPLKDITFSQFWTLWYERQLQRGDWQQDRINWHKNYARRYCIPYFGKYLLNDITPDVVDGYWGWRKSYWKVGGAGEKDRGKFGNAAETPSSKTLKMEQSAIRQILSNAHQRRMLPFLPAVKVPEKDRRETARRPSFDDMEYNVLTTQLYHWSRGAGIWKNNKLHELHLKQRLTIRFLVLFMANTGMRVGEVMQMRWEDVKKFIDTDDETKLEIRVRADTKKGKTRAVISQPNAVRYLEEVRSISNHTEPQDFVFCANKGSRLSDPNKTFKKFMLEVPYKGRDKGILCDADGDRRSLTSLRHYYATKRLELNDAKLDIVAGNMGTGIVQLHKHYLHSDHVRRSDELTANTKKGKKSKQAEEKIAQNILELAKEGNLDLAMKLLKGFSTVDSDKNKASN